MLTKKRLAWFVAVALFLGLAWCCWLGKFLFGEFGPPRRWGTDVEVKVPQFTKHSPVDPMPTFVSPAWNKEFRAGEVPIGVVGTIFRQDTDAESGLSVLQAHAGKNWGDDQ
ncbi:MAG TPA: hypothetical protein VHV77_00440, partial [Pirellulales bacterium]|nr:hypothetical protein [Pirellulales bacterium]